MPTPPMHLMNFAKYKAHPNMKIACMWDKRGPHRYNIYKKFVDHGLEVKVSHIWVHVVIIFD
jgi:hypothetical protein